MTTIPLIVPFTDLRQRAAEIVEIAASSGEPVFLTRRGRAVAVLVSVDAYEDLQREIEAARTVQSKSWAEAGR